MAREIDSDGNVRVYTFTVHFTDADGTTDETQSFPATDYADGWDKARAIGQDWESIDPANRYTVTWDAEWRSVWEG